MIHSQIGVNFTILGKNGDNWAEGEYTNLKREGWNTPTDANQIKKAFNNEGQDHSPSHLKFFLLFFAKDEAQSPSPNPRRPKPKKPKFIS